MWAVTPHRMLARHHQTYDVAGRESQKKNGLPFGPGGRSKAMCQQSQLFSTNEPRKKTKKTYYIIILVVFLGILMYNVYFKIIPTKLGSMIPYQVVFHCSLEDP